MAKMRLDTIAGVGFLVIALLLLAACQSAEAASRALEAAEMTSNASISVPISEDDREQAEATNAARWEAMGRHYSELAGAARELGAEADLARWEAKGQYYAALAGIRPERAVAADLARWEAKGEHYAALAGIRPERAAAADQARWEAKGKFYQDNTG